MRNEECYTKIGSAFWIFLISKNASPATHSFSFSHNCCDCPQVRSPGMWLTARDASKVRHSFRSLCKSTKWRHVYGFTGREKKERRSLGKPSPYQRYSDFIFCLQSQWSLRWLQSSDWLFWFYAHNLKPKKRRLVSKLRPLEVIKPKIRGDQ